MIGSAKAAVFPVPVCAMPMTSRPCMARGMVWAWIGVGVTYFSSARARRIGSTRPKSLNEVKESLFYMANRPPRSCEQRNRGVLKTSRVARVVGLLENRKRRGEIRFNELRARSPQTRDWVFHPQGSYDSWLWSFQGTFRDYSAK